MMSTSFNFSGKVFAITGGASGIGLATAEFLASHGANVSVADIERVPIEATATAISSRASGQISSHIVDVGEYAQVALWINITVEKFGKLDGAANLAGIIPRGINVERIEELDLEEWSRVIKVNLTGVVYCMKAEIPFLKIGGSIVNASSVAGLVGFAKNVAYVASKHAVVGITKSAAKEVGDRKIRVNCIAP
jgi:NAD(P)-dependent dehydrogenase (short-subunit alcohol dehydrogenase family)